MSTTPLTERGLRASIAANEKWARTRDRSAATAPGRAGLRAKYAREVDPDGDLSEAELEQAVERKLRAHMQRMTLAAQRSRRLAREAREAERALKADQIRETQ